jgi:DNA-binding beta-propeller fold protein YncE
VFLVPGYEPDAAYLRGKPLRLDADAARALPVGHDGSVTLVSRIDPGAGTVRRALMPLAGHAIAVAPGGAEAVWVAMNEPVMVRFATATLDLIRIVRPHAEGFAFGGHAVFAPDHRVVLVSERRDPFMAYAGSAEPHYGRISVRDPVSLAVLDAWDCHGIAPHDLTLTADGRHVVVANYGSTAWPKGRDAPFPGIDYGVEPCITVLELATGALAAKIPGTQRATEVRHVAAHRLDRIFGLQVRATSLGDAQRSLLGFDEVYEFDRSEREGLGYLPVPVLLADASSATATARSLEPAGVRMVRGQSIVADPVHDEAIATFTWSNTIAVIGGDGSVRRLIATDRLGLRRPRGIALMPDGESYAVAGDWENIFIFRRGSHDVVREACVYETFYGHSHLAVI